MMFTTSSLLGRTLAATDGNVGAVDDVLFDEGRWCVRSLLVRSRRWDRRRIVHLHPAWLSSPMPGDVLRLHRSLGLIEGEFLLGEARALCKGLDAAHPAGQPALCSALELMGYQVEASGRLLGVIDDIGIDHTWEVCGFLVDGRRAWLGRLAWLPAGDVAALDRKGQTLRVDPAARHRTAKSGCSAWGVESLDLCKCIPDGASAAA